MSEIRHYTIPLALLAVVAVLVATAEILQLPLGGRDVTGKLEAVAAAIEAGQWPEIRAAAQQLDDDWDAVRFRMVLTSPNRNLERFDDGLAALRGAVEGENLVQVRVIHRQLEQLWRLVVG